MKQLYVARDKKTGDVWLYSAEPARHPEFGSFGIKYPEEQMCLGKDVFPEVTWENSPVEVELKIKEANNEKI